MKLIDKVKNVTLMLTCSIIWVSVMVKFLDWIRNSASDVSEYLFFSCLCAPIFEELMFRHVPLQLTKLVQLPSEALKLKLLMLTVLLSSLIFGLAHGRGWESVLIQGVGGLALCWVYIKNGYSYWSSVTAHALWNLICLFYKF